MEYDTAIGRSTSKEFGSGTIMEGEITPIVDKEGMWFVDISCERGRRHQKVVSKIVRSTGGAMMQNYTPNVQTGIEAD
jgi:hypothetical protein